MSISIGWWTESHRSKWLSNKTVVSLIEFVYVVRLPKSHKFSHYFNSLSFTNSQQSIQKHTQRPFANLKIWTDFFSNFWDLVFRSSEDTDKAKLCIYSFNTMIFHKKRYFYFVEMWICQRCNNQSTFSLRIMIFSHSLCHFFWMLIIMKAIGYPSSVNFDHLSNTKTE